MANLQQFANNVSTLLAGSTYSENNPESEFVIVKSQPTPFTLIVAPGTGNQFPPQSLLGDGNFFIITVENVVTKEFEIFKVNGINGDRLNVVTRAEEGSSKQNFPAGSKTELRWTKESINRIRQYAKDLSIGFLHEQNLQSSNWSIVHNLNKLPEVEIWQNDNGLITRVEANVVFVDNNNILINFSEPIVGYAIIR